MLASVKERSHPQILPKSRNKLEVRNHLPRVKGLAPEVSQTQPSATQQHRTVSFFKLQEQPYDPDNPNGSKVTARLILDGGSQCSYISSKLKGLELKGQSSVNIKTFGSNETNAQVIDVVNFGIETAYAPNTEVSAFVVPLICQSLKNKYVSNASKPYTHLANLHLADYSSGQNDAEVDILIGSDQYWKIVTGKTKKGESGPTAFQTRLLPRLGPLWACGRRITTGNPHQQGSNLVTIHILKCASLKKLRERMMALYKNSRNFGT